MNHIDMARLRRNQRENKTPNGKQQITITEEPKRKRFLFLDKKSKAFVFFLPSGIHKANKFPARIDMWTEFRLYYGQYIF